METKRRVPYIEVPVFQGPLDLLLHLIQQEKVDIYDIPIARIADQFVDAVQKMESLDIEETSEFLVLAAQLIYIKSRYLLPKPPKEEDVEEEDPRQELVERLVAYRAFKQAAAVLGEIETSTGQRYFHDVDVEELISTFPQPDPLEGITIPKLLEAFHQVFERAEKGEEIQRVKPDEISLDAMINDVLRRVLLNPNGVYFQSLLRSKTRLEMVITFLALLELLKSGKLRAEQLKLQNDIILFPTEKASEFTEGE